MLSPKDWILLVVNAARSRPVDPVHLQKIVFLLARNLNAQQLGVSRFYDFSAYDYGPFSRAVYSDAEELERLGLLQIDRPPQTRFNRYYVTEAGAKRAADIAGQVDGVARSYLSTVVEWALSLDFNQLVSAIYQAYPEMKANSVFQG